MKKTSLPPAFLKNVAREERGEGMSAKGAMASAKKQAGKAASPARPAGKKKGW